MIGAITTTAVFASGATSHAAAAPRFAGHVMSRPMAPTKAKVINTFIVPNGSKSSFQPKKLTVPDVTSGTGGDCSSTEYSFLASNVTDDSQQLEYEGSPILDPIPSFSVFFICLDDDDAGGTFVLTLASDPHAKLTLNLLP